jgi:cytochrome c biogenesis protein
VVAKLQGDNYYSSVVIKVPDAKPEQLAFAGFFLPTAFITEEGVSFSGDPELMNPQLTLNSYYGDLGLDHGVPQNVFELDVKELSPLNSRDLDAKGIVLAPGMSHTLPDGKGSISFDGVKRYIGVDIHHNPGQLYALIFSLLAVAGLVTSLYVNRRRVWVRTGTHPDGRTMVEYGLLARGEDHRLAGEAAAIRSLLAGQWQLSGEDSAAAAPDGGSVGAPGAPNVSGDSGAPNVSGDSGAPGDSQSAPSGGADNDRADAGGNGASPEHLEADYFQSTAGSRESKKDQ